MRKNIVLCSFDQKSADLSFSFDEEYDEYVHPLEVTLGFRQVFWKCFSKIRSSAFEDETISWLGEEFLLRQAFFFESIDTSLGETDGNLYVAAFVLDCQNEGRKQISELRSIAGQNEQDAIFSLFDAMPEKIKNTFTQHLSHSSNFPGLSNYEIDTTTHSDDVTCALLYGFFYWGKLLLWRIRRDQADINISVRQQNFKNAIFLTAIQRSRIINIKRFQLTSNISNNQQIKKTTASMKAHLNLVTEYENDENLNTLFEEYLASLEKLFSEENRRKIERAVQVFSFIAVPFTIFGALIGLKTDAPIIRSALEVFENQNVWMFLFMCAAVPAIVYTATFAISREQNISTRLDRFREKNGVSKMSVKKRRLPIRRF